MKNRILIADCNMSVANKIEKILADRYEICQCSIHDLMEDIVETTIPDLIILELSPSSKLDVLNAIRHCKLSIKFKSTIFFVVVEDFSAEAIQSILHLGIHDFIPKALIENMFAYKVEYLLKYKEALISYDTKNKSGDTNSSAWIDETPQLQKFECLVDQIISNDLEVDIKNIAKELNYSVSTFERVIKKAYNMTPIRYIMKKRVEKASLLLSNGQMPIKDIAYIVGFNSVPYFNKCFRKFYGYSPRRIKNTQTY